VIQKNEATCFLRLFWSHSTACVPTPPPSPPAVSFYVGDLSAHCLVLWEKSMHKPQLWLCFVTKPPLWLRKKLELQNAKSGTGGSRKLLGQQQSLGSTCTSARLSKRQGRSRWPGFWEPARETSTEMAGRSLLQRGRTFWILLDLCLQ